MKAIKIIFGTLAILYVFAQVIEIPHGMATHSGANATTWWLAKMSAIAIGLAIAIALFKSALSKKQSSD